LRFIQKTSSGRSSLNGALASLTAACMGPTGRKSSALVQYNVLTNGRSTLNRSEDQTLNHSLIPLGYLRGVAGCSALLIGGVNCAEWAPTNYDGGGPHGRHDGPRLGRNRSLARYNHCCVCR